MNGQPSNIWKDIFINVNKDIQTNKKELEEEKNNAKSRWKLDIFKNVIASLRMMRICCVYKSTTGSHAEEKFREQERDSGNENVT